MTPDLINVIAAGPAAGLAVMIYVYWNDKRSLATERDQHSKEKSALAKETKIERDRANAFGEAVIELATETRIHVSAFPKTAEGIVAQLKEEHEATRVLLRETPRRGSPDV
jgi:hypothetical protein